MISKEHALHIHFGCSFPFANQNTLYIEYKRLKAARLYTIR